eukprot:TRINITY_DN21914_c0_g1_i2.p1 TRINITY_DN21914_c0_g1~~TRINITY_DN21914_c0_g1_i2.p1  ORF type:complete len:228 (+),score=60.36 TRINITY_DN21914_c0_g1_i2:90-773(+)
MAEQDGVPAPVMQLGDAAKNALAGEVDAAQQDDKIDPLKCCVCLGHAFRTAQLTVPCSHLFHKQCFYKALRHQTGDEKGCCPCCRQRLPSEGWLVDAPQLVLQVLGAVRVRCPQGCGSEIKFAALDSHLKNHCPDTHFACGWDGCGAIMMRADCGAHDDECRLRQLRAGAEARGAPVHARPLSPRLRRLHPALGAGLERVTGSAAALAAAPQHSPPHSRPLPMPTFS